MFRLGYGRFYDKIFLLASIGVAVLVAAALAGVLQLIRPPLGQILLVIAGGLSIAAIVTRTGATPLSAVGSVLTGGRYNAKAVALEAN